MTAIEQVRTLCRDVRQLISHTLSQTNGGTITPQHLKDLCSGIKDILAGSRLWPSSEAPVVCQSADSLHLMLRRSRFEPVEYSHLPARELYYPEWSADGDSAYQRTEMSGDRPRLDLQRRRALAAFDTSLRQAKAIYYAAYADVRRIVQESVPRLRLEEHLPLELYIFRVPDDTIHACLLCLSLTDRNCWFKLDNEETATLLGKLV